MTTDQIKILVVDDHALIRSTLAQRLEQEKGFMVVGTAGDAAVSSGGQNRPVVGG